MPVWQAVVLGLIQGLAEFLPISSSGHLALAQLLFDLKEGMLFFDVALHMGTLVAVFFVFWKDIASLLSALISLFRRDSRRSASHNPQVRLLLLMLIALLPLLIAVLFKDQIEAMMSKSLYIGIALVVTAVVIKLTDYVRNGKKNERNATLTDTLMVGVMQALAVVPGLSRSGMTISGGLIRGFERDFAFRFSFLLSIPAVLGATLLEVLDAVREGFDTALIFPMLVGMAVAAVSGFFALILVRKLLLSQKFSYFAWYCLAAGGAILFVTLLNA